MRPQGRRATHASAPPPHPSHPRGTNAARLQSRLSCPRHPVHPLSTIISAAAPVEGGRLGNQWAAAVPAAFGPRGPDYPEGGRGPRPPPPGSLPHSVARHARRSDPDANAGANRGASPQKPRMHAGEIGPRRNPDPPDRASREDSRPPLGSPAAALRRARPPPSDFGRTPQAVSAASAPA